jgi:hypothetical protein
MDSGEKFARQARADLKDVKSLSDGVGASWPIRTVEWHHPAWEGNLDGWRKRQRRRFQATEGLGSRDIVAIMHHGMSDSNELRVVGKAIIENKTGRCDTSRTDKGVQEKKERWRRRSCQDCTMPGSSRALLCDSKQTNVLYSIKDV